MSPAFADLGVAPDLIEALDRKGISTPFPVQELTIPDALAGRDVCGKAKTGSGKTIAFGIPLIQNIAVDDARKHPVGLALVPTRELAVQVAEELSPLAKERGLRVNVVYGGANMTAQIDQFQGGTDIVVATPGRLIDLLDRGEVSLADLQLVVIDEADRMADMGFLPQVEWLLRRVDNSHQTLLFSATLDGVVNSLIRRYQTDPAMHEVEEAEVTVDSMIHRFVSVHEMDKVKVVAAIAGNVSRTLVFCNTKVGCDRLVKKLKAENYKADAIHGDLRQQIRERSLERFSSGKLPILVATDVAARGIHVDDVDVVVHYDPPADHKSYLHRSGRTARAGESGLVVSLVDWNKELEVRRLQKRLRLDDLPIVEMFSNDPRLADLGGWDPNADVA